MAYHKCASIYGTNNSAASVQTASGAIANFNTKLAMPLKLLEIDVNATQEAGTPTPQSPKAISGVSEVNFIHCGVNCVEGTTLTNGFIANNGTITENSTYRSTDFIELPDNALNVVERFKTLQSNARLYRMAFYDSNKAFIKLSYDETLAYADFSISVPIPNGAKYFRACVGSSINLWYLGINGNTYNILFPPYPENMPYFEGLLSGTHNFVDLGSLNWTYDSTRKYFESTSYLDNAKKPTSTTVITNWLITTKYTATSPTIIYNNAQANDKKCAIFSSGKFCVSDQDYTDATTFKNAMQGVYLIYELAEPVTPTITPEQYQTLLTAFAGVYYGGHFTQDKYGHRQFEVTKVYGTINASKVSKFGTWDGEKGAFFYTEIGPTGQNFPWRGQGNNDGVKCDVLEIVSVISTNTTTDGMTWYSSTGLIRWVDVNSMSMSIDDYKTHLSTHPINVIYELATPYYIDLPDGEPITTLVGTNNIYADTGDTKVSYKKLA